MGGSGTSTAALVLRKGEERRLLAGHDWVYSNEIDTARGALRELEPGQAVELFSHRGRWLAHAYANPHSLIAARVTSRVRAAPLDADQLRQRLRQARNLRERLFPGPFYRWVYGESDGLPGLVVDRYGAYAVVQIGTAGMERWRGTLVEALVSDAGLKGVLLRCDGDLRRFEGLEAYLEVGHGSVPEEAEVVENGISFIAPLAGGQKTGWFYDQADNRARARPLLAAGAVVDACCYAGAWGVTAALAGADRVTFIDASEQALDYARRNAERNGVAGRAQFVRAEVSEALRSLADAAPPAAVVLDPPAFVKRKKDLEAGAGAYQRLNALALGLMPDGGFLLTCSCSQHVDRDRFLREVQRAASRTGQPIRLLMEGGQSPDHPVHPAMPETRYLKALFLSVAGAGPAPGLEDAG